MKTPLFPLNSLVCPGGKLPLRIFEPRYLDMVKRCLKDESGFVVVMLREKEPGNELASKQSQTSQIYRVGTLAHIIDFDQDEQGVLCVVAKGAQRVRIVNPERGEDGLWRGDIEPLAEEAFVELPDEFVELRSVLQALVKHPIVRDLNVEIDYSDGRQIGWRLTELLPFENAQKQYLYELEDPLFRLEKISDQLDVMIS